MQHVEGNGTPVLYIGRMVKNLASYIKCNMWRVTVHPSYI